MSEEFKAIETQEQLDAILKERLARQKESIEKNFADYEQLKKKVGDLESANQKLSQSATESASKLTEYEKQIAERDARQILAHQTDCLKAVLFVVGHQPDERLRSHGAFKRRVVGHFRIIREGDLQGFGRQSTDRAPLCRMLRMSKTGADIRERVAGDPQARMAGRRLYGDDTRRPLSVRPAHGRGALQAAQAVHGAATRT